MKKKVNKSIRSQDPFYHRESEKYPDPIPSREWILQVLEDVGRPITLKRLIKALKFEGKLDSLGYRLKAMLRDGQLMQDRRGRYCLLTRINLQRGTVFGHPDGFGFFCPDEGGEDMFLSAAEMRAVMHGDTVLAYQTGFDKRGRAEGKIHEILIHANANVVGRFFSEHGIGFVVPDSKRISQEISIPLEYSLQAKDGQIVLVEILAYPNKRTQAIGKVVHILGEHMAPGMETQVAILSYGIPNRWPKDVLKIVNQFSLHVNDDELKDRLDLRSLPFVTIDGEDAKDFDDAVYCEQKINGGFKLWVAIADVSHYVKKETALDREALNRGNSVYFPSQVVPMLPEALSNGICSLNPNVDRLCIVVEMAISKEGKLMRSRFSKGVIHSHARLTYTQVGQWLNKNQPEDTYQSVWGSLQSLKAVYEVLKETRKRRGAMDFDTTETKIEFDKHRKIKRIIPTTRNDAHRIIEECMLAANVATARFLAKHQIAFLYRVHSPPEEDKVLNLRKFLGEFGLHLGGGKKPSPKDFQRVLKSIEDRPEKHLIEMVMLRSLKQAHYQEENEGHFGLAYDAYTHFTSPIRRYPDLLVHRAIVHVLDHERSDTNSDYSDDEIHRMGKHCSQTERRADEATRDVIAWLKCEYMQDKIGQVFRGRISGVTGFGLFVELDEIYVEGLVHVTTLNTDYYQFDALKHRLIGSRGGKTYHLGDKMNVLVARVDLDERKIDFLPAEESNNED